MPLSVRSFKMAPTLKKQGATNSSWSHGYKHLVIGSSFEETSIAKHTD